MSDEKGTKAQLIEELEGLRSRNAELETRDADRRGAEEAIRRRLEFEKVVSSVSSRFAGTSDIDKAIDASLEEVGRLSGASRAYLFLLREDGAVMDNTQEWCAEGVTPQIGNLQNLPSETAPWWMMKLHRGEVIHIRDVSLMPPEAAAEREILEGQNIKSALVLPVTTAGQLAGFMGFDDVVQAGEWNENDLAVLRTASEIVGNALQRKRAEAELKRFQVMVESAHDAIFSKDLESRYVIANGKSLESFGLSREEVIGKNDYELMPCREEAEKNVRDDQTVFKTGEPREITKHMLGADGTERWFQAVKVPQFGDSGDVVGLVGIARDITENKRAEEALRDSEELWRTLLKAVPVGVTETDLNGRVTYVSERTVELHGAEKAEDLVGRNALELIAPEDHERAMSNLRRTLEEGAVRDVEYTFLRTDGRRFPGELSSALLRDAGGEPKSFVAITRDIAERKRAEEAIEESEQKFRAVFDGAVDGILLADAQSRHFLTGNKALCQMLGYSPDEVTTLAVPDIHRAEDMPYVTEQFERQLKGESSFAKGIPVRRKDGSVFLADVNSAPVTLNGRTYLIGIFRDITERKRAEEKLKAQEAELKRSNAELERFAYVASHDLQEPLRMVTSFLQLLERRCGDKLDSEAREFIGYAVDGAARMKTMINDLLAYSRAGTRGKPFQQVDCETVLDRALANLAVAIDESGAAITRDPLPTVMGDDTQLVQLFQNLVDNAIKFRGEEPPRVHVAVERRGEDWRFSVRDNGIGVEPRYFKRIFAVFQRLHGRDEYPGTGIGLAVCKRIVERHGGSISVESEPGKGTTFHFTISSTGGKPS